MSGNYISVVSLTYAYKAKNVLSSHGIRCKIVNTPKSASTGCGYSISVEGDYEGAKNLLVQNGIEVLNS